MLNKTHNSEREKKGKYTLNALEFRIAAMILT